MLAKFFSGIIAYDKALSFMSRKGYGKYFIYSGLLGLVLFGVAIFLSTRTTPVIVSFIGGILPWEVAWLDTLASGVSYLLSGISFLFIFKYLMLICSSPIMSALSEKVEKDITGIDQNRSVIINIVPDLIRGLRVNLRNIIRELLFLAVLFVLSFVPFVGIITTALGFLVQGFYAGWGNADFWAERHMNYSETVRYMKNEKGMLIGNGLVYVFLISIPVIGVFFGPPLATIAITSEALKYDQRNYV